MNHTELKTSLEEIGIYNHNELFHEGAKSSGDLVSKINEKIINQLSYNILTNLPTGILVEKEVVSHAVRTGLVSAIGNHIHWDINEALDLCADILEDVNAHKESAIVRKMKENV